MPVLKNADVSVDRKTQKHKPKSLRRDRAAAKIKKVAKEEEPLAESLPMGVELGKLEPKIKSRIIKAWAKTENGQNRSALRKYYYILSNLKSNELKKLDPNSVIFHRTLSDRVNRELRKAQTSNITSAQFSNMAFYAPEKPKAVEARVVILELGEKAPPSGKTYSEAISRPIYLDKPGWVALKEYLDIKDVEPDTINTWGGEWASVEKHLNYPGVKEFDLREREKTFFIRNKGVLETHPYHAGNNIRIYLDNNQYAVIGASARTEGLLGELGVYPDMTIELFDRLPGGMPQPKRNNKKIKEVYVQKANRAMKQHNSSSSNTSTSSQEARRQDKPKKVVDSKKYKSAVYQVKAQRIVEDEPRCLICDAPRDDHENGSWCTAIQYNGIRPKEFVKVVAVDAPLPKEKELINPVVEENSRETVIDTDILAINKAGNQDPKPNDSKLNFATDEDIRIMMDSYDEPKETFNFEFKRKERIPVCLKEDTVEAFRNDNFQAFLQLFGLTILGPLANLLSFVLLIDCFISSTWTMFFVFFMFEVMVKIIMKVVIDRIGYPMLRKCVEMIGETMVRDEIDCKASDGEFRIFSWRSFELIKLSRDHQSSIMGSIVVGQKLCRHAELSCVKKSGTMIKLMRSCLRMIGMKNEPYFAMRKEKVSFRHIHTIKSPTNDLRAVSFSTSEIKEKDAGVSMFLCTRQAGHARYTKNVWISLKLATQILANPKLADVSTSPEDLYSRVVFSLSNCTYVNLPQKEVHEHNILTNTIEYLVWFSLRQRQNAFCNGFPVSKKEPATFI
jgi:hypothetical protein